MRVGLDIGSTTIKCVVLNDAGQIVYSTYERHFSHILEKGRALLEKVAAEYLPDGRAYLAISGSAGMGLADSCKVPFVQEVFATRVAANRLAPGTDCIIELGGEDAKILFLTNGTEVRMNGSCAGGTGAFIDQMAPTRWTRPRRPRPAPTPSPAAAAFLPKATSSPSSTRAHRRATSRRRSIRPLSTRPSQVWHRVALSRAISCISAAH